MTKLQSEFISLAATYTRNPVLGIDVGMNNGGLGV